MWNIDRKPRVGNAARTMQDLQAVAAVDWNLIRELYTQGARCAQIEATTGVKAGTIASRASRCKWKAIATQAKQALQSVPECPKSESASESKLGAVSERTRARLARLVERSAEQIEEMTLRSPAHALRVNQGLESVVRNAKTVFGWSENTQAPAIRIGVLAQVTIQPTSVPASEPALSQECSRNEPIDAQVVDEQGKEVGS